MMHNLGLGGLEFTPNHPIEQHHPEGYRVYEESLKEEGGESELKETKSPHVFHFEPSTTERTATSGKHVVKIEIDNEGESDEIVLVKESQHRKDLRSRDEEEAEITVQVKTEEGDNEEVKEATFISMHDPQHKHPSFKGEQKMFIFWRSAND